MNYLDQMTNLSATHVVALLNSVSNGQLTKDWQSVWNNPELAEQMQENLDDLIYFTTLTHPYSNPEDLEKFVGKLTIGKILLENIKEMDEDSQHFLTIGRSIEASIKLMLIQSSMVNNVRSMLEKNAVSLEDIVSDDADPEIAAPLLMILTALMIITDSLEEAEFDECCQKEDEHCQEC